MSQQSRQAAAPAVMQPGPELAAPTGAATGAGNAARSADLGLSTTASGGAGAAAPAAGAGAGAEPDYVALATRIHTAVEGLGTDEDAIWAALVELGGDARKLVRLRQVYLSLFHESLDDALDGDLSFGDQDRADQLSQREKATFLGQPLYGPRDLAHAVSPGSGIGVGGFEATYVPMAELLMIHVTGKVQFRDAVSGSHGSFSTSHTDLSTLVTFLNALPAATAARVLPYFQWDDASRQARLAQFNQRLGETTNLWQNAGLHYEVDDPAWSDVRAQPLIQLSVGDEGTAAAGEHLQVTVYKEPTAAERAAIDAILATDSQAPLAGGVGGIRANAGSNLGSNKPGASGNAVDENPLQNEMSLSSNDLDAVPDPGERGGNNNLKRSIMFDNGVASLTPAQITDIQAWIVRFNNGDTIAENNAITLRGFASAAGTAAGNQTLTNQRIAAVQAAIVGAGVSATRITTDNRGDTEARSAAVGRSAAAQANERRVEIRIGSGERQHTVAHEFGHVFGLSDEYTEGSRTPGQATWQNDTVKNAGIPAGARVEESDNIQSVGNTVRPQHHATFAWALNQLTSAHLGGRQWHVKQ